MIIDSKKRVIRIQLRRLLTLLGVITLVLVVIFFGKLPNTFMGLNKYHWSIVIGSLYFISAFAERFLEYNYILYSDETDKIILRYFSLSFFSKKKKSIEIPKAEFTSFILQDSLWGLKKKIILRRYYKNTEAKYPAIPLSILNKNEFAQLMMSLDNFSKK